MLFYCNFVDIWIFIRAIFDKEKNDNKIAVICSFLKIIALAMVGQVPL